MASSSLRFTKAEFWLNGAKYLHQDGIVYIIRDVPKKTPKGVSWSVDMWKSRKAPAAVQKAFTAAWTAAPLCESCGTQSATGSVCVYCRCSKALMAAKAAKATLEMPEVPEVPEVAPELPTSPPSAPSVEPRIFNLEGGIVVGYKLNSQKILDAIEAHLAMSGSDIDAYDYIMDELFKDDMHSVYFLLAANDLTLFKRDIPGDDHAFYVGYMQTRCTKESQKESLLDFQALYGEYIDA